VSSGDLRRSSTGSGSLQVTPVTAGAPRVSQHRSRGAHFPLQSYWCNHSVGSSGCPVERPTQRVGIRRSVSRRSRPGRERLSASVRLSVTPGRAPPGRARVPPRGTTSERGRSDGSSWWRRRCCDARGRAVGSLVGRRNGLPGARGTAVQTAMRAGTGE